MVWATVGLLIAFMGLTLFFVIRGARRTKDISDNNRFISTEEMGDKVIDSLENL